MTDRDDAAEGEMLLNQIREHLYQGGDVALVKDRLVQARAAFSRAGQDRYGSPYLWHSASNVLPRHTPHPTRGEMIMPAKAHATHDRWEVNMLSRPFGSPRMRVMILVGDFCCFQGRRDRHDSEMVE